MRILLIAALLAGCPQVVDTKDTDYDTGEPDTTETATDTGSDTGFEPDPLTIMFADFECNSGEVIETELEIPPDSLVQVFTRMDNHLGVIWWADGGAASIEPDTHTVSVACEWVGDPTWGSTDLVVGVRVVWITQLSGNPGEFTWREENEPRICSYEECPILGKATRFVDSPYQVAGSSYRFGSKQLDYQQLGEWCRAQKGQTIVCEGPGADWLPFEQLHTAKTARAGKPAKERIWLGGV